MSRNDNGNITYTRAIVIRKKNTETDYFLTIRCNLLQMKKKKI